MEQRKDIMTGIIRILILFIVGSIFLARYGYKYFKKPKPKEKPAEVIPEEAIYIFRTADCYRKPFQGYFCFGCCRIWKF